jgi:hypothetical protein
LEILLDGTDITPPGWSHDISFAQPANSHVYNCTSPAIGGVKYGYIGSTESTGNKTIYENVMVPASVPIPFDSSLVVNFIHLESNISNLIYVRNICWVNAWLTE